MRSLFIVLLALLAACSCPTVEHRVLCSGLNGTCPWRTSAVAWTIEKCVEVAAQNRKLLPEVEWRCNP